VAPPAPTAPAVRSPAQAAKGQRQLRDVPDDVLAAELQRRGWVVMEP
jgi:hypothetical protein